MPLKIFVMEALICEVTLFVRKLEMTNKVRVLGTLKDLKEIQHGARL